MLLKFNNKCKKTVQSKIYTVFYYNAAVCAINYTSFVSLNGGQLPLKGGEKAMRP